jgi:hypothetical protein
VGRASRAKRAARSERHAAEDANRRELATRHASPEYAAMIAVRTTDRSQAVMTAGLPGQEERLRRAHWEPRVPGDDGLGTWDQPTRGIRLMHSVSEEDDGEVWAHLSVSLRTWTLPEWRQLKEAQWLCYPDHAGIVVVAPKDEHVNVAEVLHVWTKLTGPPVLPDFRKLGQV